MINVALLTVLAVSVLLFIYGHNRGLCLHKFKVGGGIFGDAWRCTKCGLDKYPENVGFKFFYKLTGRVHSE